jgi:hypothetical protein
VGFDPRKLRRPLRFLLLAAIAVMVGLYLRGRSESFRMHAEDRSMEPVYPAGSTLRVRVIGEDAELEKGVDVLYAVEGKAHFGRVRGLAGDEVGSVNGELTVNGERIEPRGIPGDAMGRVPEGTVLILALNPFETRFPDSRRLGFIPRAQVRAIILGRARP